MSQNVNDVTSLMDYLYLDKSRVVSILSQVIVDRKIFEESITEKNGARLGVDGKVKVGELLEFLGIGADIGAKGESTREITSVIKQNPEWAQAAALVSYVTDHEMQYDKTVEVSQLRSIEGSLSLYDIEVIRRLAENDLLVKEAIDNLVEAIDIDEDEIANSNKALDALDASFKEMPRAQRRANRSNLDGKQKDINKKKDDLIAKKKNLASLLGRALTHFVRWAPFSTIGVMHGNDGRVYWFTIKQDGLVQEYRDYVLKFGHMIEGSWVVCGIIDGLPEELAVRKHNLTNGSWLLQHFLHLVRDYNIEGDSKYSWFNDKESSMGSSNSSDNPIWRKIGETLANQSRLSLGRPSGMYGISPIIIYRKIGTALK